MITRKVGPPRRESCTSEWCYSESAARLSEDAATYCDVGTRLQCRVCGTWWKAKKHSTYLRQWERVSDREQAQQEQWKLHKEHDFPSTLTRMWQLVK